MKFAEMVNEQEPENNLQDLELIKEQTEKIGTGTITDTDIKVYGAIAEQINREFEERDKRAEPVKGKELPGKHERTGTDIPKEIARATKRPFRI